MSRIGKLPIQIPSGVTVSINNQTVDVNGPKGSLSQFMMPGIDVSVKENQIIVSRIDDQPVHRSKHGLMRSLINNMIIGVTEGFNKKLEIHGVGYRAAMAGNKIKLNIGFSHDVFYEIPNDIQIAIEQNNITVSGIVKQQVGQVAAEIRALKKPEPYKGKGIRYESEQIIRKSGKSGKDK